MKPDSKEPVQDKQMQQQKEKQQKEKQRKAREQEKEAVKGQGVPEGPVEQDRRDVR